MIRLAQFEDYCLSKLLINQLQLIDDETGNSDLILQEIEILEGKASDLSSTKIPTQYKHLPLKGLWHKHFFMPEFIVKNLCLHLGIDRTNSNVSNIINQVFDSSNSDVITEDMVMNLVYELTEGGMKKRADEQKLTGEWIIYAKYEGKNYYLTLALHDEDDNVIHKRIIDHCKPEFPFLF
ncbi:hypothetical protein H6G25_08945 [Dolichospermum sp. FACHB-1091]|uniref:hypothetical protein n=1 Tax=Dolichospermum sp. FACHB-1091 TaxID=2692798 RepID=UPI001680C18D|nr:hypothetical protein [Dolichospermum sp. FACHB-1091]MBD2443317.1 hypothetical protein [Dolichospermum sp. FACHB-1091]